MASSLILPPLDTSFVSQAAISVPNPRQPCKNGGDARASHTPSFVVMKFGGTSVAKHLSTIVDTIVPAQHIPSKRIPLLVCSAQSYTSKTEGTTQCLLAAIEAATTLQCPPSHDAKDPHVAFESTKRAQNPIVEPYTPPPTPPISGSPEQLISTLPSLDELRVPHDHDLPDPFTKIIDGIFDRHVAGANRVLSRPVKTDSPTGSSLLFSRLETSLRRDCDRAIQLLRAVQTLGEISSQTRDKIVSIGELMACRTVVAALESQNIPARLLDLTNLDLPSNIQSREHDSLDLFIERIKQKIDVIHPPSQHGPYPILVATGFFGQVPGSLLDYIGRGYTDVCAALCARAVEADEIQIWKEVDGVFSADPRKITNAHLLPKITCSQAKLLTSYGSEVIHHRAIDQAISARIPIVVRNVVNPTGAGTLVDIHVDPTAPADAFAVTILNDLELIDVSFNGSALPSGHHPLSLVLDTLKDDRRRDITLDLVTSSQDEISFVVSDTRHGQRVVDRLSHVASVTLHQDMSYVLAVFDHKNRPYAFTEILKALLEAQIEISGIFHRRKGDGVGFLVSRSLALKAVKVVHDKMLQV